MNRFLRTGGGVANTDDGGCGAVVLDFDGDGDIVTDGLSVAAEVGQVCCRANREGVALETSRHVNNAISSHGARRDAGVRNDVDIWVTSSGGHQDGGRVAPIGVGGREHIDGGSGGGQTATVS